MQNATHARVFGIFLVILAGCVQEVQAPVQPVHPGGASDPDTSGDPGASSDPSLPGDSSVPGDANALGDPSGATFQNLTPPAWPAEIYVDVAADITAPTYTLTPELIYYDYYKNAATTPYRVGNTVPIHTPRSSEGIVAGDSLHIVARAVYDGTEYAGIASAAKTVLSSGSTTSLAQLPYASAGPTVDGVSGSYDGVNDMLWDGNVMLGPVLDPNGSGRTVNLHRIMEAAPYAWGTTHRCELLWGGDSEYRLPPAMDTWQAFAVMRKVGENLPESTADDAMLVFQSHSPEMGDTYPPYSLVIKRQGTDQVRWYSSYNTRPPADWDWNGGAYPTVEGQSVVHSESLMPEGEWYRYVVHYRAGYLAEHNPLLEVWRATPGQAYEKLFADTGFNAYNGGDGYPRIGPYKWDSQWNGQGSLAFYMTPLYYGRGADLYDQAVAALLGL